MVEIIDLSLDKHDIVSSLKNAMSSTGFFYLKNHGVDLDLLANLEKRLRDWFEHRDKN